MRRGMRTAIATVAVMLCLVFAGNLRSQGQAPSNPGTLAPARTLAPSHPQAIAPSSQRTLINQYCVACHNDKLKSGGLTLSELNLDAVRPERRGCREGHSQAARRSHAAGRREAPRCAHGRRVRHVAREQDRRGGDREQTGTRRPAPAQSPRVRLRDPRSDRAEHRRDGLAARGQHQGQLRQQRRRPAGLAEFRRPVHLRRARRRARGDRQPEGACRDDHLRRRRQHGDLAAAVRWRPAPAASSIASRACRSARAAASASNTTSRPTATTSSRSATWRWRAKCRGWSSRTR